MKKQSRKLTHDEKVNKCQQFIKNFQDYELGDVKEPYEKYGRRKYLIKLQQISNEELDTFQIYVEDLQSFFRKEQEKQMVEQFKNNTIRYNKIFEQIADKLFPLRNIDFNPENEIQHRLSNILKQQRRQNLNTDGPIQENQKIPRQTYRQFDVSIVYGPGSKMNQQCISDFSSQKIGAIVVCKAIVIRATEVKPQLIIGTYTCDSCGSQNYYQVNNQQFGPIIKCQSKMCIQNNTNGKLSFLPGHSKFKQFQQLKIQQTPDQLKQGKIPRNFSVQLKGHLVKQAVPGDIIMVQGVLLPKKKIGFNNDLTFTLHMVALKITRQKKKYIQMSINQEQIAQVQKVRANYTQQQIYQKLTKSIAPQIFGHQSVKKSLLLLMTGGVTKVTADNLKIRGQINVALFGDPGIAKSQLLKHISYLAPRGVYTTGKGSSGVGLTAAVVKDPNTNQLALQAGALVLADMGVCCIDQFDKMDQYDRTAIHEVMEQQTISIAKAGITTSLNARTSILAAANPLYGRYDNRISAQKNINLPAALLSRFDLIFVLLDKNDKNKDIQLAKHIAAVHQKNRAPSRQQELFTPEFIRTYVALSKQYTPVLSTELHKQIIDRYISKRQQQMSQTHEGQSYTTMRSLLAILRLAQARARLRFSNQIAYTDVKDAIVLVQQSQQSIATRRTDRKGETNELSAVYRICSQMMRYKTDKRVSYDSLKKAVLSKGYSQQLLQLMIKQYETLNVLMRTDDNIVLVEQGY